jgi:hypothetical protein
MKDADHSHFAAWPPTGGSNLCSQSFQPRESGRKEPALLGIRFLKRLPALCALLVGCASLESDRIIPLPGGVSRGALIYSNPLASSADVADWKMDGPGEIRFDDGWMLMQSPGETGHHVFWCPRDFPADFIAEWDAKKLHTGLGLCIVFFAAKGVGGEGIFDPSLPSRTGLFAQYVNGAIRNYHVSYYANPDDAPDRRTANIRKNPGSHLVMEGDEGIPTDSAAIHRMTLIKNGGHVMMLDNGRKFLEWTDDGRALGPVYGEGKIGFRQMQWTRFRYRDFRVWALQKAEPASEDLAR